MSSRTLSDSYDACCRIARGARSSFYLAFLSLPRVTYRRMCALYAFLRLTDDVVDGAGSVAERRERLRQWHQQLQAALAGETSSHPIWPAVRDVVDQTRLPPEYLFGCIDGVATDLEPRPLATWDDVERYCYLVAGVVGLSCLKVWRCTNPAADRPAVALGTAFQLTNILRDVCADARIGRCYLPVTLLQSHGLTAESLATAQPTPAMLAMLREVADLAKRFYADGETVRTYIPRENQPVLDGMTSVYRLLLDRIASDPAAVFRQRVAISRFTKLRILAWTMLAAHSPWA